MCDMQEARVERLMVEFLGWVSRRPRSYGETMEAWRSTCPRISIWEDAVGEGLVEIEQKGSINESFVRLTTRDPLHGRYISKALVFQLVGNVLVLFLSSRRPASVFSGPRQLPEVPQRASPRSCSAAAIRDGAARETGLVTRFCKPGRRA